jgi:hypothetical protein
LFEEAVLLNHRSQQELSSIRLEPGVYIMRKIVLCAIVGMILAGGAVSCLATQPVQPTPVEFTTIAKGDYSAINQSSSEVIKDQETWAARWAMIQFTCPECIERPPPPEIDFGDYILLAHFMGQKSTSGYEVEFTEVLEGDEISATVKEVSPASGCIVGQVITAPYEVIQIPKTDKQVKFTVQQEIQPCPIPTWVGWPMFHGDPQRTGIASGAGIVTNSTNFQFSFNTQSQPGGDPSGGILASPVVANDGTIYVASKSPGRGTVYALDSAGNLKTGWPFSIDAEIANTPAIGPDNTIYLSTYVTSTGYNFFALNSSGAVKWKLRIPEASPVNFTFSSPVVVTEGVTEYGDLIVPRSVIYVSAPDNGYLYKIVDDDTYGRIAWGIQLSYTSNILLGISSPAVGPSGTIYVGILDPTLEQDSHGNWGHWGKLAAVNPDGSVRWRQILTTTNNITSEGVYEEVSSPAVAVVHYPDVFHNIPPGDYETVFAGTTDHRMKAVRENPSTHNASGEMDFGASGGIRMSCPAIYDLNGDGWVEVIFGTASFPVNNVYAVSFLQGQGQASSGFCKEYWHVPTGGHLVYYSPAVALAPQPTVFVCSTEGLLTTDNQIYSIKWDGTILGIYTIDDPPSSPAVAQEVTNVLGAPGWVFVGSADGKLYAFGPAP